MQLNYGQEITLATSATPGSASPDQISYVWNLWDGTKVVTRDGFLRIRVNRDYPGNLGGIGTITVCGSLGQVEQTSFTPTSLGVTSTGPVPVVTDINLAPPGSIFPFVASLSVGIAANCDAFWFDATGSLIGSGAQIDYTVKEAGELAVKIQDKTTRSYAFIRFLVSGVSARVPKSTRITKGVRPFVTTQYLNPCYVATASKIDLYGAPKIDGVQVPSEWSIFQNGSVYSRAGAARILVKNQVVPQDNGIYVSTSNLEYTYALGSSIVDNSVVVSPSGDSLLIANNTLSGASAVSALEQYFESDTRLRIEQGLNFVEYEVTGAEKSSLGFSMKVALIAASSESLTPGISSAVKFGWKRAPDKIQSGYAARVRYGMSYAGVLFVSRMSRVGIQKADSDKLFWMPEVSYSGGSGGTIYFDSVLVEPNGEALTTSVSAPGIETGISLAPDETYFLRVKTSSKGLDSGSYRITQDSQGLLNSSESLDYSVSPVSLPVVHTNYSQVPGYQEVPAATKYSLAYTSGENGSLSGNLSQEVAAEGSGTAVTAVPASGFYFNHWSDGSTSNPRTDAWVTQNVNVIANFSKFRPTVATLSQVAAASTSSNLGQLAVNVIASSVMAPVTDYRHGGYRSNLRYRSEYEENGRFLSSYTVQLSVLALNKISAGTVMIPLSSGVPPYSYSWSVASNTGVEKVTIGDGAPIVLATVKNQKNAAGSVQFKCVVSDSVGSKSIALSPLLPWSWIQQNVVLASGNVLGTLAGL